MAPRKKILAVDDNLDNLDDDNDEDEEEETDEEGDVSGDSRSPRGRTNSTVGGRSGLVRM